MKRLLLILCLLPLMARAQTTYHSYDEADTDGASDLTSIYRAPVAVAISGNATELLVYATAISGGSQGIKLGLYDQDGSTLLTTATSTTPGSTGWTAYAITPTAVTAGTYFVTWLTNPYNWCQWASKAGGTYQGYFGYSYASGPPSPWATDWSPTYLMLAGITVEAGGPAPPKKTHIKLP